MKKKHLQYLIYYLPFFIKSFFFSKVSSTDKLLYISDFLRSYFCEH